MLKRFLRPLTGSRGNALLPIGMTCAAIALSAMLGCTTAPSSSTLTSQPPAPMDLARVCQPEAVQAIAAGLSAARVTVRQVEAPPPIPSGVRYVAASGERPAYCQVSGAYLTNPATGKTASFLAVLPSNWNGKYLQLGCSGHCGNFAVSDPTTAAITITTQGRPGDILARGYAAFATDEGHVGFSAGSWALDERGQLNQDALDDFLVRAQRVLVDVGKEFTTAFYAEASGAKRTIARSYFSGCSGGGRDALVAASYFPEEFDGIIAGSPYANVPGKTFQIAGGALAHIRAADADVTPAMMSQVAELVMAQCDGLDGVRDQLIQNPAACNFRPERDLPRCAPGPYSDQCFTSAQIETVSVYLTALTDENGAVLQPAYSVSNLQAGMRVAMAPASRDALEPWPNADNTPGGPGGLWALADANIRIFAHRNAPNVHTRSLVAHRDGGPGAITDYRTIVDRAEFDLVAQALRSGTGAIPENADRLVRRGGKLLIWSNSSDQLLTPYMATNYYEQLAARHGGYRRLQRSVRLFNLPGTIHCSMGGVGVNSFDALGAMEAWVERGQAPDALVASQYPARPDANMPIITVVDYEATPLRTMPLCAYPAMARYDGEGDVNDAANWSCPAEDRRMLVRGESGRRAGVLSGVAQ